MKSKEKLFDWKKTQKNFFTDKLGSLIFWLLFAVALISCIGIVVETTYLSVVSLNDTNKLMEILQGGNNYFINYNYLLTNVEAIESQTKIIYCVISYGLMHAGIMLLLIYISFQFINIMAEGRKENSLFTQTNLDYITKWVKFVTSLSIILILIDGINSWIIANYSSNIIIYVLAIFFLSSIVSSFLGIAIYEGLSLKNKKNK